MLVFATRVRTLDYGLGFDANRDEPDVAHLQLTSHTLQPDTAGLTQPRTNASPHQRAIWSFQRCPAGVLQFTTFHLSPRLCGHACTEVPDLECQKHLLFNTNVCCKRSRSLMCIPGALSGAMYSMLETRHLRLAGHRAGTSTSGLHIHPTNCVTWYKVQSTLHPPSTSQARSAAWFTRRRTRQPSPPTSVLLRRVSFPRGLFARMRAFRETAGQPPSL